MPFPTHTVILIVAVTILVGVAVITLLVRAVWNTRAANTKPWAAVALIALVVPFGSRV